MGFSYVVTFESDKGEPVVVRGRCDDSDASEAARRAVFRALPDAKRLKYESVVIVLEREPAPATEEG